MDDRRRSNRYLVWMLMQLKDEEKGEWLAVSRNMSQFGALVATAAKLVVGQPIAMSFQISPEAPELIVEGTIVRMEENVEDPKSMWPHRVAVEFEDVLAELEPHLEEAQNLATTQSGQIVLGEDDIGEPDSENND